MLLRSALLATFCLYSLGAKAQDINCDPALFKDFSSVVESSDELFNALMIVDSDNYEYASKSFKGSVGIPIEGIPFEFGSDYEQFDENRREYFSKNRIRTDRRFSRAVVENKFSTLSGSAYQSCLDSNRSIGVHVRPENIRPTGGNIRLRYESPPGVREPITVAITEIRNDKTVPNPSRRIVLLPSGAENVPFIKPDGEALSVTFSGGGYDIRSLYFPATIPTPPPPPPCGIATTEALQGGRTVYLFMTTPANIEQVSANRTYEISYSQQDRNWITTGYHAASRRVRTVNYSYDDYGAPDGRSVIAFGIRFFYNDSGAIGEALDRHGNDAEDQFGRLQAEVSALGCAD